jgi:SAM-dependent methyltransferase
LKLPITRRDRRDWGAELSARWATVPAGDDRRSTHELAFLDDDALLSFWREIRDREGAFDQRGWYRLLYRDTVPGRRLLDIGCGLALDTLTFAEQGALVTCADLAVSNVRLVERIASLLGVSDRVEVVHLESPAAVEGLPSAFDAILALGSLHHAPQDVVGPEVRELAKHLKPGGRWLQLAYPRVRWQRDGSPSFEKWGEVTDGPRTPWAEWYDADKLLEMLAPHPFRLVFQTEWHGGDFNWFDLVLDPDGASA